MNSFQIVAMFLVVVSTFVSCKTSESEKNLGATATSSKKPIAADAKIANASFTIEGMTCAIGCAKTIEKKLNATDGVQKATVDFEKKTGTVSYDIAIQNTANLKKIVEAAADGVTYKVTQIKS